MEGKLKIRVINTNLVEITLPSGKVFTVSSDNGSAPRMASKLLDWSELFSREDQSDEVTHVVAA